MYDGFEVLPNFHFPTSTPLPKPFPIQIHSNKINKKHRPDGFIANFEHINNFGHYLDVLIATPEHVCRGVFTPLSSTQN